MSLRAPDWPGRCLSTSALCMSPGKRRRRESSRHSVEMGASLSSHPKLLEQTRSECLRLEIDLSKHLNPTKNAATKKHRFCDHARTEKSTLEDRNLLTAKGRNRGLTPNTVVV